MLNKDYKEMLQCLFAQDVRFLLVGAPLNEVSTADFSTEGIIFQIGNSPRRIDIITRISGIKFEQAYANRAAINLEGMQIPVISLDDLIINKRASGRLQDLADVERLLSGHVGKSKAD